MVNKSARISVKAYRGRDQEPGLASHFTVNPTTSDQIRYILPQDNCSRVVSVNESSSDDSGAIVFWTWKKKKQASAFQHHCQS